MEWLYLTGVLDQNQNAELSATTWSNPDPNLYPTNNEVQTNLKKTWSILVKHLKKASIHLITLTCCSAIESSTNNA